jgi:hypothetical protein
MTIESAQSERVLLNPNQILPAVLICPEGKAVVSAGYATETFSELPGNLVVIKNEPLEISAWAVVAINRSPSQIDAVLRVTGICVSIGDSAQGPGPGDIPN